MPNKPDKFGIKFRILAELNYKYCLNVKPHLGKDDERVVSLGAHVVLKLMEPYFGRGYNVTMDNSSPAQNWLRNYWTNARRSLALYD